MTNRPGGPLQERTTSTPGVYLEKVGESYRVTIETAHATHARRFDYRSQALDNAITAARHNGVKVTEL